VGRRTGEGGGGRGTVEKKITLPVLHTGLKIATTTKQISFLCKE